MSARAQILADEVKMQLRHSLYIKTTTEIHFVNNLWQKQVETFLRLSAYFKWNVQNLWTIIQILKYNALKTWWIKPAEFWNQQNGATGRDKSR